jgi:putative dimethyl sulfoxide reductase chaperone
MESTQELRGALADDLAGLIRLHERELDAGALDELAACGFPDNLALLPDAEVGKAMRQAVAEALAALRCEADGVGADAGGGMRVLEVLAADYAAIYLNNALRASPYESVWLHEEHLACQQPMFELRDVYAKAGLRVDDWRKRYDDHFVLQFQFLAERLRQSDSQVPLAELGAFLDEHVGYWFPDFAARVAQGADTPVYAALAVVTAGWLSQLRELIENVSGEPRTTRETIAQRIKTRMSDAAGAVAPIKFMPGAAGPSW